MRIAAFFDMDRTLIRANSATLWLRFLRQRGEIGALRALRAIGWIAQYKLAVLDMEAVIAKATMDLRGEAESEMIEKCNLFTESLVLPEISPVALKALEKHRGEGHVVAILSTSSPYVAEPLAKHLGIEHVLCTRLVISEGRFSGMHVRPACAGAGKVHWAERFAREHDVDLTRSWFYTDSYSDLPMLERVGEPRVVNPDLRLARHAKRVGWTALEW